MKNFETIAKAIENQLNSGNSRMTICTQNEFGGVYFLHVTVTGADTKPYAQYKEALTIYFKKRGGRTVYGMRIYGEKPIAIFSGWPETMSSRKASGALIKTCFTGLWTDFRRS